MAEELKTSHRRELSSWFREGEIELFGFADLRDIATPRDEKGSGFPRAVSFAVLMNSHIMQSIRSGPNQDYANEYNRVNFVIDEIAASVAVYIRSVGFRALAVPASERTDPITIRGDFPHKTAATRAGLGWIGRNCLLITKRYGPWLRLGTVLTDVPVHCDTPVTQHFCGTCRKCVDACPAGALVGNGWRPGEPRENFLDVMRCDEWKKEYYFRFNEGHNCGICAAVCPFGR